MLSIFENYSQSRSDWKADYMSVETQMNKTIIKELLEDYLKKNKYEHITYLANFQEVYGVKNGFEVTFHIISQDARTTRIVVSVFGEFKYGRTRKYLKNVLLEVRPLFK